MKNLRLIYSSIKFYQANSLDFKKLNLRTLNYYTFKNKKIYFLI